MVMKNMIPVVMAGVLGIYGLIVAVIITQKVTYSDYHSYLGIYGLIVAVIITQKVT